jgi:hypothetical protein
VAAELLLDLWRVFDNPAVKRGVVDCHTPLAHHLFELAIADRVRDIPPDTPQDDFFLKLAAFKVDHTVTSTSPSVEEHSRIPINGKVATKPGLGVSPLSLPNLSPGIQ